VTSTILVADDNPVILETMALVLNSFGYTVKVAADGHDAWEEVGRCQPHLVVLDIEMPRLNGCEVCQRIKSQPETKSIPVILVSGRGDSEDVALQAGADAFLSKPFFLEDLKVKIDSLLSRLAPQTAQGAM
jgi:CheY-like chemotaxis protein